jgi:tetratricopeptide (TPR) repeat protein
MGSYQRSLILGAAILAIAGCSTSPFRTGLPGASTPTPKAPEKPGSGPIVTTPEEIPAPAPGAEPSIEVPPPAPLPRERPKVAAATLGPASTALVSQAQSQRKRGDIPGATVSIERAMRIEPNNPLLWIEMGRLRMDQANFPQAESMGRKALSMSVGDDRTQSLAWQLISDSFKARGKNPQAQDALERSKALAQR